MKNKLKALFDYQKFMENKHLSNVIDDCLANEYVKDENLAFVFGGTNINKNIIGKHVLLNDNKTEGVILDIKSINGDVSLLLVDVNTQVIEIESNKIVFK